MIGNISQFESQTHILGFWIPNVHSVYTFNRLKVTHSFIYLFSHVLSLYLLPYNVPDPRVQRWASHCSYRTQSLFHDTDKYTSK